MKAVVIDSPRRLGVTELPPPAVGPGEVMRWVAVVGYCGSDLNTYRGFNGGPLETSVAVVSRILGRASSYCKAAATPTGETITRTVSFDEAAAAMAARDAGPAAITKIQAQVS